MRQHHEAYTLDERVIKSPRVEVFVVRRLVTIFKLEVSLALEISLVKSKRKSTIFFFSF
jgi:hypothetical protein